MKPELLLACVSGFGFRFAGNLVPAAHVSDPSLVTRDHNLGALCDRSSIFAACPTTAPCPQLLEDDLPGAAAANRAGHVAEHTHHVVLNGIDAHVVLHKHLHIKRAHDGSAAQTGKGGEDHGKADPDA